MHITESIAQRFWNSAKRMPNGCLEWQGRKITRTFGNYGLFRIGSGRSKTRIEFRAHRVAYCIENKCDTDDIDDEMICHRCNNPICVDPKHIYKGTWQDNLNDKLWKPYYALWR